MAVILFGSHLLYLENSFSLSISPIFLLSNTRLNDAVVRSFLTQSLVYLANEEWSHFADNLGLVYRSSPFLFPQFYSVSYLTENYIAFCPGRTNKAIVRITLPGQSEEQTNLNRCGFDLLNAFICDLLSARRLLSSSSYSFAIGNCRGSSRGATLADGVNGNKTNVPSSILRGSHHNGWFVHLVAKVSWDIFGS